MEVVQDGDARGERGHCVVGVLSFGNEQRVGQCCPKVLLGVVSAGRKTGASGFFQFSLVHFIEPNSISVLSTM